MENQKRQRTIEEYTEIGKGYFKNKSKNILYMTIGISAAVVISACLIIAFFFCVYRYEGLKEAWNKIVFIFQPFIIGFVMAFLMNPIMTFFEQRFLGRFLEKSKNVKKTKKRVRTISTLLSLVIFLGIVALFLVAIIPELTTTIKFLADHITEQIQGVLDWANQITGGRYEKNINAAKNSDLNKAINQGIEWLKGYLNLEQDDLVQMITTGVISVGRVLVNSIIGIIVSVYVLIDKEVFKGHCKKIIYGIFKIKYANSIMEIIRKTNDIFYGFIIGKLIDSFIIGIICYVCCLIMHMPYALLVSVIIGVTNIIPVFGPYIGAVPTVIIIFLTSPMQGIYFLIFVLILQQVDGNIIGPKILGDSTGLSSFWVVVAIVVGGGLFGIVGMLIGVPIVAVLYYLCGRFFKFLLRKKDLPENTAEYVMLNRIEEDSNKMVQHTKEDMDSKKYRFFSNRKKPEAKKEDSQQEENKTK